MKLLPRGRTRDALSRSANTESTKGSGSAISWSTGTSNGRSTAALPVEESHLAFGRRSDGCGDVGGQIAGAVGAGQRSQGLLHSFEALRDLPLAWPQVPEEVG